MLMTAVPLLAFWLLLSHFMKALPMERYDEAGTQPTHQPPAWALDFSTPPAELEPADFEILRALSDDLSQPPPTAPHGESEGGNDHPLPRSQRSLVDPNIAIARQKSTSSIIRARIGHPEPSSLTSLPYYEPFRDHHRHLTHGGPPHVPSRIVDAFGGKLRWIPPSTSRAALMPSNWHDRSPYKLYSRRLPLRTEQDGQRLWVHMTQHNLPPRAGGLTQGTELHGRPYYGFWGVSEELQGEFLPVVFYGLGTLERQDNEAVDRRLAPLIEEWGEMAKA